MTARNRLRCQTIFSCIVLVIPLFCSGCGETEQPPFFTAQVLDIWNQTFTIENFKVLYAWEERGETPFLRPYDYHARELVVEVMVPIPGDAHRVDVVTRKIPFQNLKQFEFIRGAAANTIKIILNNNEEIIATDKFPRILKKGDATGLADYATFVEGVTVKDGKREKFKADLYNIKKVVLLPAALPG